MMIPKSNLLNGFRTNKITRVFHKPAKASKSLPSLPCHEVLPIAPPLLSAWLSSPDNLLVLDLRARDHFRESHLLFANTVNIPPASLRSPNLSDEVICSSLSEEERVVFDLRFKAEFVVVVDYFGEGQEVARVAQALTRYSTRDVSFKVAFLEGGFVDFARQFPHMLNAPLRRGLVQELRNDAHPLAPSNNEEPQIVVPPNRTTDIGLKVKQLLPKTKQRSPRTSEVSLKPRELPPKTAELPPKTRELSPKTIDVPHEKTREDPPKPPKTNHLPPKTPELPPKSSEIPPKIKELPPKTSEVPPKVKELPPKASEVPPKTKEPSPISPEVPRKNGDVSPEPPAKTTAKEKPKSKTPRGLKNTGNTCFMNAVIQSLANVRRVSHYFLSNRHKRDINQTNSLGFRGEAAELYHTLLAGLQSGGDCPTGPLQHFTASHCNWYTKGHQHDAHEFLHFLLDALHEDLKRCGRGGKGLDRGDRVWRDHLERNQSIIADCFQGLLRSTITCLACGAESSTFEVFMSLALPLPEQPDCSLNDSLLRLLQVERIEDVSCDRCGTNGAADKRVGVWRYPPTLIVFFVRFVHSEGRSRRKDTLVRFPLEDWRPDCLDSSRGSPQYSLTAVVNHAGSLNYGHYTCDVLREGQWMTFDDVDVRKVQSPAITKSAYILFYDCSKSFI